MGFFSDLFSRGGRVGRGQARQGADDATFETILRQTVRDTRSELTRVMRSSAEAMSHYNRLESEHRRYESLSESWKNKAKLALGQGNDDLATKALTKKQECDGQMDALRPSVDQARCASRLLRDRVGDLRRRIEEGERNAGILIARRNAARANKRASQALAGVSEGNNAFAALAQFEDTVHREEVASRAYQSLSLDATEDLREEFRALAQQDVSDEIAALKAELAAEQEEPA